LVVGEVVVFGIQQFVRVEVAIVVVADEVLSSRAGSFGVDAHVVRPKYALDP
jgi:hypothetical protein